MYVKRPAQVQNTQTLRCCEEVKSKGLLGQVHSLSCLCMKSRGWMMMKKKILCLMNLESEGNVDDAK